MDFNTLLQKFDLEYKEKVPQRFQNLNEGIDINEKKNDWMVKLKVDSIPDEMIKLYHWKNGFKALPEGWTNEFEEDSWFELIPRSTACWGATTSRRIAST